MSFADVMIRQRRVFLLRFLIEAGGNANEGVLYSVAQQGGFRLATRDDIRTDLDSLRTLGCVTEEWLGSTLRVVTATERGEDVAYGRIRVDGVEHSLWRR